MIPGKMKPISAVVLILLPVVSGIICMCIGRMAISPEEVIRALFGLAADTQTEKVVLSMRLPRVLSAALVGAGLAVSGCAFQSLFANPLATPDTLGVASGASFGAALAMLLGFGFVGIQLSAAVFGAVAMGLTVLAGWRRSGSMTTIILAGIVFGSLFKALISLVKYVADTESQLPAITYWLMGSLNSVGYSSLAFQAPLVIAGIVILYLLRWRMNLLPLSDDEAKTSGVNIKVLRGTTIACATVITAGCISVCGPVEWVGLLVPHICRMRFGNNNLSLIPASISLGAAFVIVVDTIARSLTAAEIPVSILTALVGAPFFIVLMRKGEGWKL